MNTDAKGLHAWSKDLESSRDVSTPEKAAFGMLLGWLEKFRESRGLEPGREACEAFWREQVLARAREEWQKEQWAAAIRWYLRWLRYRRESGGEVRGLAERVRRAVDRAGGRRGLARRTRETYGRWAGDFAKATGDERAVMTVEAARDYLTALVVERRCSFSTQKQALNALVFFFREVCGQEEVVLDVRLRKTERRIPVVLDVKEVLAVLDRMEGRYGLMGRLQYGAGLRLNELVNLRVKDVDEARGTVTVRAGKGGKDRVTVLPEKLRGTVAAEKTALRGMYEKDRADGLPGVWMPGALDRRDDGGLDGVLDGKVALVVAADEALVGDRQGFAGGW